MFSRWSILSKFVVGLALLALPVAVLAFSGLYTMYVYRSLVKSLSWRALELPLAAELSGRVSDLRITLGKMRGMREIQEAGIAPPGGETFSASLWFGRDQFQNQLTAFEQTLARYRAQLEQKSVDSAIGDNEEEWETVRKIEAALVRVHEAEQQNDWILDKNKVGQLDVELAALQSLSAELPGHLHNRLQGFASDVRNQYRALMVMTWIATISAVTLLAVFVVLGNLWLVRPLRALIAGSRRVAGGAFSHRIHLDTHDEMAELAEALNDMTARFRAIRDDLDRQVEERTRQAIRSEQLASVGFLAAGVAHEINNPLASIAMCAESLEGRVGEALDAAQPDHAVIAEYLRMIQTEAFRCKEITERLLDFSRGGSPQRADADLGALVESVIDMVRHLGKYQRRTIEFDQAMVVVAPVSAAQIKQVALNLLTNALDSVDDGGTVRIGLSRRDGWAELVFSDDGCGMEPDVLEQVFEPFFTRKRTGQGTGLGLAITHRIVSEHGGEIEARSGGPGQGATFRVRLPLDEKRGHEQQSRAA